MVYFFIGNSYLSFAKTFIRRVNSSRTRKKFNTVDTDDSCRVDNIIGCCRALFEI